MKTSALIETIPNTNVARDKQKLLEDTREALGTEALSCRMNRVVTGTRSKEGFLNLSRGKMYMQGLTVEVDYEKSASSFLNTIRCRSKEAFAYLGRQYAGDWGFPRIRRRRLHIIWTVRNNEMPNVCMKLEHVSLPYTRIARLKMRRNAWLITRRPLIYSMAVRKG